MRRMKKVCFIGIDGSGKTEHLMLLKTELEEKGFTCEYTNLRGLYFRIFSLPFLYVFNIFYPQEKKSRYIRLRNINHPVVKFWVFLFYLDIWLLAIFRGYFSRKVDILLSDRGVIDSTVDLIVNIGDKNLHKSKNFEIFSRLLRTDFTLLLDVNSEVAHKRKKETEDIDDLKERRKVYLKIAEDLKIFTVNTERPFNDVHADIEKFLINNGVGL